MTSTKKKAGWSKQSYHPYIVGNGNTTTNKKTSTFFGKFFHELYDEVL